MLYLWNSIITLIVGIVTIISFFLSCIAMFRTREKLRVEPISFKSIGKTKELTLMLVNSSPTTLSLIRITIKQKHQIFTTTIKVPSPIKNLYCDTSFINTLCRIK